MAAAPAKRGGGGLSLCLASAGAIKALVAIGLFGIVAIGFLFTRLTWLEQGVALVASLCLLGEFDFSDTLGFVLAAAVVLWQWRQRGRNTVAPA